MPFVPNPRDPITQRTARTLRETLRDPYAYAEGPAEQQLLDVARSFTHAARVRRAGGGRRIDVPTLLGITHTGCFGNCNGLRRPCTMPGVCGAPRVRATLDAQPACTTAAGTAPAAPRKDWPDPEPAAPAPAEACTELGVEPWQQARKLLQPLRAGAWFWLPACGLAAAVALVWWTR